MQWLRRLKPDDFSWRYQVQFPLLAHLPPRLSYKTAAKLSQSWQARHMGGLDLVREQMRSTFPQASVAQIDQWAGDYTRMIEQEALDTWYLERPQALKQLVQLQGFEQVEAARTAGQRVLLVTGHLGRFWLAGPAMRARGFTVGTLTRDGKMEKPAELHAAEYRFRHWKLERLKASLGGPFLVEGESVRPLYAAVDKHLITLLFDVPYAQNPPPCVTVPFLNGTIKVPTGIYKIAKKTQALIAPFYMRDLGNGGVVAEFSDLLDPNNYNEEDCLSLLSAQLTGRIINSPGQWWLWAALPLLRRA